MKLKSYTEEGQYFDNVEFITRLTNPASSLVSPMG